MKKVSKLLAAAVSVALSCLYFGCSVDLSSELANRNNQIIKSLEFTITYDANGGSGTTNPSTCRIGEEIALSDCNFTAPREYKFAYWNSSQDGSGVTYNAGDTFAIDSEDVTLYAIWIPVNSYTITYYNTNSVSNSNVRYYTVADTVTLSDIENIEHYTFGGWYTTSTCAEGTKISGWTSNTKTGNLSLYAKWNPKEYTVSYVSQYGSKEDTKCCYGETLSSENLTVIPTVTDDGKTLYCYWYIDSEYETAATSSIVVLGNITLYAKWIAQIYVDSSNLSNFSTNLTNSLDIKITTNPVIIFGSLTETEFKKVSSALINNKTYISSLDISNLLISSLPDESFHGMSNLKKVTLPDSLEKINYDCFCNCTSLEEIYIPDSVTLLGQAAFFECTSLKHIYFGENSQLAKIGVGCFTRCNSLIDFTLPKTVTELIPYGEPDYTKGNYDFSEGIFTTCSALKTLNISNTLKSIDKKVFYSCYFDVINFGGTMAEWNAISINTTYNGNISSVKVVCSDGTINE